MNHPQVPPSLAYLCFVRDQARVLARRAERSGLHKRARHYRLRGDWAKGLLEEINEAWQAKMQLWQEHFRQLYPGWVFGVE